MGQLIIIIRADTVTQADMPTIRQQFTAFLQTTLPNAVKTANPATQATFTVDKQSTYAEQV